MTDFPKIQAGDRVRIVIEDEVTYVSRYDGTAFDLKAGNTFGGLRRNVVSVEVLAKPYKVGDTVSGGDYAKLPIGTIVRHRNGTMRIKRDDGVWANIDRHDNECTMYTERMYTERTIAYLPDAS